MLLLQILVLPISTHYILTMSEEEYVLWTPLEPKNWAQSGKSLSFPCMFVHLCAHLCVK